MKSREYLARNLRFALWRAGVVAADWPGQLGAWLGTGNARRAEELLRNGGASVEELDRIADASGIAAEELTHGDSISGFDVLAANLRFLLDSLEHGGRQELAKALETDPSTVSRWRSGRLKPGPRNLAGLRRFFQLPPDTDLKTDPFFLSLDPVGNEAKRRYLEQKVRDLPTDELSLMFPALRKLLDAE